MAVMQIHDKADFSDIVLRDQISQIVFIGLPQISAKLIKVCQEETFKGPSVVLLSVKTLGRYLCLVFEDYERKMMNKITHEEFKKLVDHPDSCEDAPSVLRPNNQSQENFIANLKKSNQWILEASKKLAPAILKIKCLRGNDHRVIRHELVNFSWSLIKKCLPNIKTLIPFLLENLVLFADDSDNEIQQFSQSCLSELSEILPDLNQEIAEIFTSHLTTLPRIILTGDESEQIAGFTLLNSFTIIITNDNSQLNSLLNNSLTLDKFLNVMLSSCEIEVPSNVLFYESAAGSSLDDQFYQMKMPWKKFKNLKSDQIVKKFTEICRNIGKSKSAELCVNFLQDNMSSIEHLVFLIEILYSGQQLTISEDQVEGVVEEFLSDTYWTMKVQATKTIEPTQKPVNEKWFKHSTPGLYESAVEIKLRDVALDEEDSPSELNLRIIKYNILSTCFVLELIGAASKVLEKKFQRFMLRTLHRVLEKAGSSNFVIRCAGIYALEMISSAMGCSEVSELINSNSDYLLFNIQRTLKRKIVNDSVLDMLTVIFKYSKSSMTSYIKDIVETAADRIASQKFSSNTLSYLKLFRLYAGSVNQWDGEAAMETNESQPEKSSWSEVFENCLLELEKPSEDISDSCPLESENDDKDEPMSPQEESAAQLPTHVNLIINILSSSLQFFASSSQAEVILTHEIFIDSLTILHRYEDQFLPMVHRMWYPFTKQFQVQNLVILQFSFRLLGLVVKLAKDFVHNRSTSDVIPVINKFLNQTFPVKPSTSNISYTQEFKLQREILSGYGSLAVNLDMKEKDLDGVVNILLKYSKHSNEQLALDSNESLTTIESHDPGLICFKKKV